MSVKIIRNTGWIGCATNVQIKVNGKKTAKIKYNQHMEVEIPDDKALLKVSQFGSKSNEITVMDGDVVKILTSKWSYISILIILLISLMYLLPLAGVPYQLVRVLILSAFLIMFVCIFVFDGFNLKVIEREQKL